MNQPIQASAPVKLNPEATLDLVRALSENKIKRDPTCRWRPKKEAPPRVVAFECEN